jgi:hypothetical protein
MNEDPLSPELRKQLEEEKQKEEELERLNLYLEFYTRAQRNATDRKARLETLMKRRSAKKWSVPKKQKMARRYMAASQVVTEAGQFIDQIQIEIERLSPPEPEENVAE